MAGSLYSDADLALLIRMSRSWIRKERMRRRAGLPHHLTVDAVMIGSSPRYRVSDIEAWLEAQTRDVFAKTTGSE